MTSNVFIGELLYDTTPATCDTPFPRSLFDIVFKNVVFPAPDGPITAKNSPGLTPPVTLFKIQRGCPLDRIILGHSTRKSVQVIWTMGREAVSTEAFIISYAYVLVSILDLLSPKSTITIN